MDYKGMRAMLKEVGAWAPPRPSTRAKTLRCGGGAEGRPIAGAYLNESRSGRAFLTLNVNRTGRVDFSGNIRFCDSLSSDHWREVSEGDLPDHFRGMPHRRHVQPRDDVEREALRRFLECMC